MTKTKAIQVIGIAIFFCSFLPIANRDLCSNFLSLLDESKIDEASALTTDSFKVKFNYSGAEKTKIAYFDYCRKKVALKTVNHIDSIIESDGKIIYLVKNGSDLNRLIKLKSLPLKYSFEINNDKISSMRIDTLKGYNDCLRINDRRWNYFETWAQKKHPESRIYYLKLQHNDSLIMFAKEFYASEVKK